MWKKLILLFFYLLICLLIFKKFTQPESNLLKITLQEKITHPIINYTIKTAEQPIGYLKIDKINLYEALYPITSKNNNIEKHVTILQPSQEPTKKNTTIFLAAHSGTGKIAYFKNLDQLSINDFIKLTYNNKEYIYIIKSIWETKKTGTISIPKETTNQLVLTTCSPKHDGYQLIINAHIKRTNQ